MRQSLIHTNDAKPSLVVHAVCDWDGCPLKGQRHGVLPATDEPPHPVFQVIQGF